MTKKIGFVDYYISEWHANNYPAWIKEVNARLGFSFEVAYAWAERDDSPVDGVTTDAWCEKMGVTKCETIAELCEKSDVIMILAPSNPEKHLQYASEVLPYGKRTYIDKTFAPDLETAKQIFAIAEKHGTPFFSTSALRYAEELGRHREDTAFLLMGGGSNFEEYVIHLVEMAVVLLGSPALRVRADRYGYPNVFYADSEAEKKITLIYTAGLPYSVTSEHSGTKAKYSAVKSPFFMHLIREILRFYESGVLPFDSAQTLEAMRLRDALLRAAEHPGAWIEVDTAKES